MSVASPPSSPTPPSEASASPPRSFVSRSLGTAAALVALILVLVWVARATDRPVQESEAEATRLRVATLPVPAEVPATVLRRSAGRVEARRASTVGFELSGRLVDVSVDEGERVRRGAIIARLDRELLQAQRAELVAVVAEAQADLALAEATADRHVEARRLDAVSPQALDEAERGRGAAQAALARARAAVDAVDVQLDKSSLRAPFDARIARRLADEGQVLAAGEPVLDLLEDRAPDVRFGLPSETATRLEPGAQVDIEIEGGLHAARVRSVAPRRERATRTVDVVVALEATAWPAGVQVGDLAYFETQAPDADRGRRLPLGALTEGRRGLWAVAVVRGEIGDVAAVERRQVEVVHATAEAAWVRGPFAEGDRVVAAGVHRLVPGLDVEIGPAPSSSQPEASMGGAR
ncbi:MAG: efflux RND transporter periplasmic adaptor subunit [Acidobacteriota bacterium]